MAQIEHFDASGNRTAPAPATPLPSSGYMTERTDVASAARTVTGNSATLTLPEGATGAKFFLNITAAGGTTPTLDVKVQERDPATGNFADFPTAAAFAQKSAANDPTPDTLTIYAGITVQANRAVSNRMPKQYRIVWTIGGTTPSFTFSVGMVALP